MTLYTSSGPGCYVWPEKRLHITPWTKANVILFYLSLPSSRYEQKPYATLYFISSILILSDFLNIKSKACIWRSQWIQLHGQGRSDPRSAHLFWASWYIRPWAMEFYLRCSLMRKASDDDRAAILTLSLSFASLSIRCSSAALQVVSDALEWRQGHADPDTPEQGGRGSLHPAHYHQD